jgi:hypothetical protein|uniref:Uncharacterized protein n=1 Tax=Picea glauca TaxID=3330 RepID=A0A101M3T4_PICGL|nr:hypothetical protein ABT39_MTgene413 [Picea glauca]QHR92176.1 hypothetical protein Q903MT_gene6213 [Picea sitchensis]
MLGWDRCTSLYSVSRWDRSGCSFSLIRAGVEEQSHPTTYISYYQLDWPQLLHLLSREVTHRFSLPQPGREGNEVKPAIAGICNCLLVSLLTSYSSIPPLLIDCILELN